MPDLPAREQFEAALSGAIMTAVAKQENRIKAGGNDFSTFEAEIRAAATETLSGVFSKSFETMGSAFGASLSMAAVDADAKQRAGAFATQWAAQTTAAYQVRVAKASAEAQAKDDQTAALALLLLLAFSTGRATGLARTEVTRAVTASERLFVQRLGRGVIPDANVRKAIDSTGGRGMTGDVKVVEPPPERIKPPAPQQEIPKTTKRIDLPKSAELPPPPPPPSAPPPPPPPPIKEPPPPPPPKPVEKPPALGLSPVWVTQDDARVCPICLPLHEIIEKKWPSAQRDGPPAHPFCRCFLRYKLVPLSDLGPAGEEIDVSDLDIPSDSPVVRKLPPEEIEKLEKEFAKKWVAISSIDDQKAFARQQAKVKKWVGNRESSEDIEAVYQSTQKKLAEQGVSEIEGFRGMQLSKGHKLAKALASGEVKVGDSIAVNKMTAVSFSEKLEVAGRFASPTDQDKSIGVLVKRTIPAADVLASQRTTPGFGRAEGPQAEREVVTKSEGRVKVEVVGFIIDGKVVQ